MRPRLGTWSLSLSTHNDGRNAPESNPAEAVDPTQALRSRFEGRVHTIETIRDTGSVLTRDGRHLPFTPSSTRIRGLVSRASELRPGLPVVFDVSETATGPRITHLWTGEGPWRPEA
jgi:hypothetical protein